MHTLHALPQLELEAKKDGIRRTVPKSQGVHLISVLDELISLPSSAVSSEAVAEKEEATSPPPIQLPVAKANAPNTQAAEPTSQPDSPDDAAKAS